MVALRLWLCLWCENAVLYTLNNRKGEKQRSSRGNSVVMCLAKDSRQDLNGETVAVSTLLLNQHGKKNGCLFYFSHNFMQLNLTGWKW